MAANNFLQKEKTYKILLFIIIAARLVLNAIVPLMDKTEARYAEIARIMAETGNWVTPQVDYNFPFWAKPPMSTWLSAISIKMFGANEFAARFPSFVIAILLLLLLKPIAKRLKLPLVIPAFILFTIPEFLLHVGVVSTDMTLLLSMTLLMVSFWETMDGGRNYWKYLSFVGIGLGFLAKGPIVLILTMPPIFVWAVRFKEFKAIWKAFPWLLGVLIVMLIAVPWYYLAEQRTPGFLDYFFVGEHFKRFFDSSWKGDKYGFPKQQPMGMIWVFLYALAVPWIIFVTYKVVKFRKEIFNSRWLLFLILWIVWTPLFFTVSKSLIHTYTLPVAFPIALFVASFWDEIKNKKAYFYAALVTPALSLVLIMLKLVPGLYENNTNTDKYILKDYHGETLYYWREKTYSSQFYSAGKVKIITPEQAPRLDKNSNFEIIIPKSDTAEASLPNLQKISEGRKAILYKNITSR